MAEATISGQNAAKKIITVIHKDSESLAAMSKPSGSRNAGAGAVDTPTMFKTAKAGGAASDEAGAYRCKRKSEDHPATAGQVVKVAKLRDMKDRGNAIAAAMHIDGVFNAGSERDVAVQSAKVAALLSATSTVEQLTATDKFLAGDFKRALAAVETLGLQWTTRQQRAALRGATFEQRAVAYSLAESLFAAKMRQWAAIKLYWAERRKCVEAQKAVDDAGLHGMAYVNCTAIREGYTGVGKEKVLAADAAMAAASAAICGIRSNATVQKEYHRAGEGSFQVRRVVDPSAGLGQKRGRGGLYGGCGDGNGQGRPGPRARVRQGEGEGQGHVGPC